jgi:hypothetical protein
VSADLKRLHSRLIDILEKSFPHLIEDDVEKLSEHAVTAEGGTRPIRICCVRPAHCSARRTIWRCQRGLEIFAKRPKSADRDRVELQYQKLVGVAWMAAKGWGAGEALAAYEPVEALCEELADEAEGGRGPDRSGTGCTGSGHGERHAERNTIPVGDSSRTKAEVLAQQKEHDAKEAEALFRHAVEAATRQHAQVPALRAATGWARLLTRQHRKAQARIILDP